LTRLNYCRSQNLFPSQLTHPDHVTDMAALDADHTASQANSFSMLHKIGEISRVNRKGLWGALHRSLLGTRKGNG
jgi:hypothetical protein